MERKKEMTKKLLADSFKELMLNNSFKKITIKMITDGAGVIRPTFYNYFKDKYEILEYCFEEYIMKNVYELIDKDMELEALKMIFIHLDKNKEFIKRSFEVTGQNSFKEIVFNSIYNMFNNILDKYGIKETELTNFITKENISRYYTIGLVSSLELWLNTDDDNNGNDMFNTYKYLISHSVLDIIETKII